MNLHEIQNLSFAELKERRDELVKLAGGNDVAARYIQALTDAKMRDEKLAEQGVTIKTLQDGMGLAQQRVADLEATCTKLRDDYAALQQLHNTDCDHAAKTCSKLQAAINELGSKLAAETARANRNAQLAARSEAAINGASKLLQDVIALRMVETTNEGA